MQDKFSNKDNSAQIHAKRNLKKDESLQECLFDNERDSIEAK